VIDMAENTSQQPFEMERFKRALEDEYSNKAVLIRKEAEKAISERVFSVRRDTEIRIHHTRQEQKKRYLFLLERERRLVILKVRQEALNEISRFLQAIAGKVEKEISKMRSDPERYGPVLRLLVIEALDVLGTEAVVKVFPGESHLLPSDPRIMSVEEDGIGLASGGCVVEDFDTRSIVVDNSISTRWNRFQVVFRRKISENFVDVLQGFNRFSRELRIS